MTKIIGLWQARVTYLVVSVALWVAVWPLRDYPLAMRVTLGLAVLANVLFFAISYVSQVAPLAEAARAGQTAAKAIGYQAGYRDGLNAGQRLASATEPNTGAELIHLEESDVLT